MSGVLEIDYSVSTGPDSETDIQRDLWKVTNGVPFGVTVPLQDLQNPWDAPFFVEDRRHVFYLTTQENPVWIPNYHDYGAARGSMMATMNLPPLLLATEQSSPIIPKFFGDGGPNGPGVIDSGAVGRFVTQDAYIRQGLGSAGKVQFGGVQIGPSGAISNAKAGR
jgi:hypothetical protein